MGQMKSFQLVKNDNMANVTSDGRAFGRTMEKKIRQELAPSIRALSSSAIGIVVKNWRMKNTPKAPAAPGTIRDKSVSSQPSWFKIRKFGIRKMKLGTNRV